MRFPPAPALLGLTAILVATSAVVRAQPTDLGSYVLFAEDEFHANGLLVVGGNLGVNAGILSSAGRPLLAANSTIAAGSVRLESRSLCAALFANDVQTSGPGCSGPRLLVPPILDLRAACGFPDPFPHCDQNAGFLVLKGTTETLAPGTYGQVRVKNGGTLTLSGGDYVFCSLHVSRNAQVLAFKPTRISIEGDLVVSNSTRLVPGSTATPCDLEIFATGTRAGIQRSADVQARLCAPNASLHIDHRARIVGTFAAKTINAGRITAKAATALECPGQATTTTTTTTTTVPGLCGNSQLDPGEACDPPGSLTCSSSVSGAFLACNGDCSCPSGSTTTTTLAPSSTTSTSTSSTTTTVSIASTTTTIVLPAELCGNCIDDDRNNLTDFEDPACCAETQRFAMALTRGRIRPAGEGSRLRVRAGLASSGLVVDPLTQDVFLQIRPAGGTDILCAKVPATKFMRMHGAFKFWDQKHTVESAQGLDDMAIKVRRNGTVRFRTLGRRVRFKAPPAGNLQVTVAFYNAAAGDAANRCSTTTQPFRTGRGSELLSP